jgi:hypothetical protein
MSKETIHTVIAIVGFLFLLGSNLVAIAAWFERSAKKRYAAEDDFRAIQKALESHKFYLDYLPKMEERFIHLSREIDHTKNSMKQMTSNSISITDGIEHQLTELRLELKEIKALVTGNSQQITSVLTRLDAQSGIWGKREQ